MALRIAREPCILGRPRPLGPGRCGLMQPHSPSDRSVGYPLLSMARSVRHHQARQVFSRQFLEGELSEVRVVLNLVMNPGLSRSLGDPPHTPLVSATYGRTCVGGIWPRRATVVAC